MYRNHLEKLLRTRLDDILVDEGVLDRERMDAAHAQQDQSGKLLSDVLIDSQAMDEWDLAKLVASHYALPFVDVKLYSVPGPVFDLLPLQWCRDKSLLPLDQFGKSIVVACVETPPVETIEEIVEKTGCTVFLYVTVRRAMRDVIDEAMKRRGNHTAVAAAAVSAARAAQNAPAAPVAAAAPAKVVATDEDALPPLDLPRVSLQLNASAASVAHGSGMFGAADASTAPRKPQFERAGRPVAPAAAPRPASTAPTPQAVPAAAAAPAPVTAPTFPVPVANSNGGTQRVSPIQKLLNRGGASPVVPQAPATAPAAPAAAADESPRPKLGSRAAPVLPGGAEPARAKPPAPGQTGWESIFDIGDDAVHRTTDAKRRTST